MTPVHDWKPSPMFCPNDRRPESHTIAFVVLHGKVRPVCASCTIVLHVILCILSGNYAQDSNATAKTSYVYKILHSQTMCNIFRTTLIFIQQTMGINGAGQTGDITTETWIACGNSTWYASNCRVHTYHQRRSLYSDSDIFGEKQAQNFPQHCTNNNTPRSNASKDKTCTNILSRTWTISMTYV